MKTRNFVIEVIEDDEKRVFVIRELSPVPQQPPITREVCLDAVSVGEFFASLKYYYDDCHDDKL